MENIHFRRAKHGFGYEVNQLKQTFRLLQNQIDLHTVRWYGLEQPVEAQERIADLCNERETTYNRLMQITTEPRSQQRVK